MQIRKCEDVQINLKMNKNGKKFSSKMKRWKMIFFLSICIFANLHICTSFAFAQEIIFSATSSSSQVGLYEQFQLTFSLKNASAKNLRLPQLGDFHILSGPNQSTQMQWVNGNMSQSVSYSYVLQPKSAGKFTIEPATVEVSGKNLESNKITIEVLQQQQQPQPQKGQAQQQSGNSEQDVLNKIGENVFLRVVANKTDVFQGEQIVVTYKLYTRLDIVNLAFSKLPPLNGFWYQDVEQIKQLQYSQEQLNGIAYNTATLKRVIAFPQRSGTLEIDPMELELVVRIKSQNKKRNAWDDFFGNDPFFADAFGGYKDFKYNPGCNKLKINVRSFPNSGKPSTFNGAVGKFNMETALDKTTTKTDEPITLKIKIKGQGNIKLIDAPKLELPSDIETYEPKMSENISTANNMLSGNKNFDYLLIPRRQGEYKLPEFKFSYFDPEKKQYETLSSPSFTIQVEKGTGATATSTPIISGINKEDVKLIGQDIRFIKTGKTNLKKSGENFLTTPQFFVSVGMPFLLFFILMGFRHRQEKLSGNISLVKYRKAHKMAKKRFAAAQKYLNLSDKKSFYDETARALWGYAGDKLGITPSELTKDNVNDKLREKNINEELIKQLLNTIDTCEMALFAPTSDSFGMEKIYQDSIELIAKIEEQT